MAEWVLTSSLLILLVIAVRRVFRGKISPRFQYALWLLVLLRLLLPFSLYRSAAGPANLVPASVSAQVTALPVVVRSPLEQTAQARAASSGDASMKIAGPDALTLLWLGGMAATAGVLIASNLRFARLLRRTRRALDTDCPLPVYVCGGIPSPCLLFGKVYITPAAAADETRLRYALAHEVTHHRHGDEVWGLLRCLCLAIHWYNPLVWWAAVLSRRDGELACDEAAVRALGEDRRLDYGRTLIGLTAAGGEAHSVLHCATTMTGSKRSLKERINALAKKPRNLAAAVLAVTVLCAAGAGCAFSGAQTKAAPIDPVVAIQESMAFSVDKNGKDVMTFTVPDGVTSVSLSGRLLMAGEGAEPGSYMSYHYSLDNLAPGKTATYSDGKSFADFSELFMSVTAAKGQIDILSLYEKTFPGKILISNVADTKKALPLTAEQLAQLNMEFAPLLGEAVNPLTCFFTSYYDRPQEMDFAEFLRYFPLCGDVTDETEFEALKALPGWSFGADATLENMPVPIHRYTIAQIDRVLYAYAGISMRDLTDTASGEVLFLPKYDAYYNFTSDAGLGGFTAASGTVEGDTVRLTSADGAVLTLRAVPSEAGRYFIVSFLQG